MKNIILIGFMGTGKTSTGRLLASKIGYSFIDSDQRIEQLNKMTVKEMFSCHGETYFRQKEYEIIKEIAEYKQVVISTGGGVVVNPENITTLKKNGGIVIALTASIDVILERTGRRNTRPLLDEGDRRTTVSNLLASRHKLYSQADFEIDTSEHSPLHIVEKIIDYLQKAGVLRA